LSDDFPNSLPVFSSHEEEQNYWLSKTPWERIQALQLMNREKYGDAAYDAPLAHRLEIETPNYVIRMWLHRD